MAYYVVCFISMIVRHLPSAVRRGIAALLGPLCWLAVSGGRRKMAIENIMRGLEKNQPEAEAIARASVTRFGKMFVEILCMPVLNADKLDDMVRADGLENLTEALSAGKGVVLATAHFGNWELLGAYLAMKGFPLVAVAQKQHNESMDRFINAYRTRAGMHVTYRTGVREMIRLLGQGSVIGLLMDQDSHKDGVFIDFLGRTASTPQGPAALARMKDAPIVPAFIVEDTDGKHRVILRPPIRVNKTEDRDQDILATTKILSGIIEEQIKQYPHEWFWLHNRWKTQPPHDN